MLKNRILFFFVQVEQKLKTGYTYINILLSYSYICGAKKFMAGEKKSAEMLVSDAR